MKLFSIIFIILKLYNNNIFNQNFTYRMLKQFECVIIKYELAIIFPKKRLNSEILLYSGTFLKKKMSCKTRIPKYKN